MLSTQTPETAPVKPDRGYKTQTIFFFFFFFFFFFSSSFVVK